MGIVFSASAIAHADAAATEFMNAGRGCSARKFLRV